MPILLYYKVSNIGYKRKDYYKLGILSISQYTDALFGPSCVSLKVQRGRKHKRADSSSLDLRC